MHPNEPKTQSSIEQPPVKARESVSKVLVETRRGFDQDLRAVADALRIRYDYLLAIEEGRFQDLPGSTYAVGFVRTYAEYLNLDVEEIVNRFKEEISGFNSRTELVFPKPTSEVRVPGVAIVFFSALLIAVAYGTWFFLSADPEQIADRTLEPPADYPADTPVEYSDLEAEQPAAPAISAEEDAPLPAGREESEAATPSSGADAAPAAEKPRPVAKDKSATAKPGKAKIRVAAGNGAGEGEPARNGATDVAERPPAAAAPADRASDPVTAVSQPRPAQGRPEAESQAEASGAAASPQATEATRGEEGVEATPARETLAAEAPRQADPTPTEVPARQKPAGFSPQIASTAPAEAQIPEAPALDAPRARPERKQPPPASAPSVQAKPPQPPLPPASPPRLDTARPGEVQVGVRPQGESPTIYGAENRDARIVLRAIFDSYVLVRDEKDGLLMTKVLRSGDEYRVPNRGGLSMLTGNAGGLRIEVDGRRVPSVGPVGAIVRNVALDPDRLRSGTAVTR